MSEFARDLGSQEPGQTIEAVKVRRPWRAPLVIESTVGHHTSKSSNTFKVERKTSSAFTSLS